MNQSQFRGGDTAKFRAQFFGLSSLCSVILVVVGCAGDLTTGEMMVDMTGGDSTAPSCRPIQATPYASGIPYLGVHANAANSDYVDCETAGAWTFGWHSLRGYGMTQPNTFSPDGRVTYMTSTNPQPDGCRLFAIDTDTGAEVWCKPYATDIERSAVEVDQDGLLYFTVDDALISLSADGQERWRVALTDAMGQPSGGWGVHFTPQGHVATVTASGRVYLVERTQGRVLDSLDIAEATGFVGPETFGIDLDPSALLPESVQQDIRTVWGNPSDEEQASGFSAFLGSGKFVDNTIAISERGDIYVIGGGPTPQQGALVQVRVMGDAAAPVLSMGWHAVTNKGSATTPSISKGDRWVVIGDGAHPSSYINPSSVDARSKVYDIANCDDNRDADPDPSRCALDWEYQLERGPMVGAPAILEDGTVVLWETGLNFDASPTDADVVAVGRNGVVWKAALPDDMDWTSVITVTRNHVIGTASRVDPSDRGLPGFKLPNSTADRLVVLDKNTGELVWYTNLPDDSAATVTVGPDGSLYVPMLGLFSILAIDDRPTLGIIRFLPDYEGTSTPMPPLPSAEEMAARESATTPAMTEGEAPANPPAGAPQACFDVVIDELEPCCDAGPAHCVDIELPERFANQVEACPSGGVCVPDPVLEAVGTYAPQTCTSVGGVEGACASTCLTEVAASAALLPKDICGQGEVCVPCISPLDGEETGVCGVISCGGGDAAEPAPEPAPVPEGGMSEPQMSEDESMQPSGPPPSCCGGAGTCLDAGLVPDEQEGSVRNCRREGHRELLCVPNEFLDATWTPQTCVGRNLLGGDDYDGVCLPECLKLPLEFTLDDSPCPRDFTCAPCESPLTGQPTGAPGCN